MMKSLLIDFSIIKKLLFSVILLFNIFFFNGVFAQGTRTLTIVAANNTALLIAPDIASGSPARFTNMFWRIRRSSDGVVV